MNKIITRVTRKVLYAECLDMAERITGQSKLQYNYNT